MGELQLHPVSLERMVRAVEKVRDRLRRATAALSAAKVPYAVADGNAVAAWVARVDEAAVRNTQDVDILIRREDLEAVVRMKLTSFRLKDRVHLLDMIEIDLINESWPARFAPELAARLQELLDNPDG